MKPDYNRAATVAMQTLIEYGVNSAPVAPIPILKATPGTLVLTFTEMSMLAEIDRDSITGLFGANQDAATFHVPDSQQTRYFVAYNQRLPLYMVQRAVARELGHILLGHNGSRPEDVRDAEAYCFAHHLLCPRPLIHAIQQEGIPLTVEIVGSVTGCYERCMLQMRREPGARVDPALNRAVRDQFAHYISNYVAFQRYLSPNDESGIANLGTYMENYEE
jgi:hypothetical protein